MNQYRLWRYILIVILIVLGVIYALPVIFGEDPAVQITTRDSAAFPANITQQITSTLTSQKVPYQSIKKDDHSIVVLVRDSQDQIEVQGILQAKLPNSGNYSVALNLEPRTPKWLLALGAKPMKLGLDLRGGVHFLFKVDVNSMVKTREKSDMRSIAQQLREKGIRYAGMVPLKPTGFIIRFRQESNQENALDYLKGQFRDYLFSSQEKNGEPVIVANMTQTAMINLRNYAVQQNLSILRTRVQELGITEPVIQQQGADQISVDLPGIQDMAQAKSLIGKMATIRFQLVDTEHDAAVAARTGVVPFGTQLYKDERGYPILLKSQVILSGDSIINASPSVDQNGRPAVSLRLGGSQVASFNRITGENINKPLAVVLIENQTKKVMVNNKVVSKDVTTEKVINVATIQSALGNNFEINGLSSMQYASNLALLLRSGAYSARMTPISERLIGPSLGKKNIEMGTLSLEIGSALVILFMLVYYRLFGLIANMALLLNIIFIVAILSIVGGTLSLPGIAGIVLTVGMAVDANVLINERIREELRNGVSPQASINAGYSRAFSTIVDANVTTLIIMVVLLALGSSTVQNLAVTVIIGLLTSMVTAIFFTRAVVNLIYGRREVKQLSIGIKV